MNNFTPYEKLSKKKKREQDRKKRKTWAGINPVTRKPQNPKAYNRQKSRRTEPPSDGGFFILSKTKNSVHSPPYPQFLYNLYKNFEQSFGELLTKYSKYPCIFKNSLVKFKQTAQGVAYFGKQA